MTTSTARLGWIVHPEINDPLWSMAARDAHDKQVNYLLSDLTSVTLTRLLWKFTLQGCFFDLLSECCVAIDL